MEVLEGRRGADTAWDIPLRHPSHHWAVPLAIMDDDGPRRVGTAFHFSRLGHLFTARHCIDEALDPRHRGVDLGIDNDIRVIHPLVVVRTEDEERQALTAFAVQTVTGPQPTDLVCLSTVFQARIPQLTLPLSFELPPAGSIVRCFGYPESPSAKLFPDVLHAVEGTVKAYFPPGFDRGFFKGPCFLVGVSAPHGMSGGPVVNEQGAVCGVVSAGAELFFGEPACLVTPLYPAILTDVALHAQFGPAFRLNGTRSLIDLCMEGHVTTDGTENRVHFARTDEGVEVGPMVREPSGALVYDSYEDYLAGQPSSPLRGPRMRIVTHSPDSPDREATEPPNSVG